MNINRKNKDGDTSLLIACKNGNIELIKYLLSDYFIKPFSS
jgi:ankyrin repeat protein